MFLPFSLTDSTSGKHSAPNLRAGAPTGPDTRLGLSEVICPGICYWVGGLTSRGFRGTQVVAGGIHASPRNSRPRTSSAPTSCLRAVAM